MIAGDAIDAVMSRQYGNGRTLQDLGQMTNVRPQSLKIAHPWKGRSAAEAVTHKKMIHSPYKQSIGCCRTDIDDSFLVA